MSHNFLNFYFNLFGIDDDTFKRNDTFKRKLFCRIPVFYNSLGPEYKTKVITLPPKINTITSNEEKNMKMSMEMLNSFNTCFSRLKFLFFFVKIYDFG